MEDTQTTIKVIETPGAEEVPSLLMCVGRQYYTVESFIREAESMGPSKRIPVKSIPEGIVPMLSKIFCACPEAILKVTNEKFTLFDLAVHLVSSGVLSQKKLDDMIELDEPYWQEKELPAESFVPEPMLDLAIAFSRLEGSDRKETMSMFGIETCMGIVGWSYIRALEYVLPDDVDQLPEELQHLEGYITPVHVTYTEDIEIKFEEEEEE